ncbi:flp pilus-assembly TadE/G-like family protein [Kribbella sp. NBC_01505]|uniref:Rv3654c family TadE-like protein n=1 Tax=Kribbella sp. NBC_01505 TaxID=2903580 RepID=UPI003863545F
MTSHHAHPCDEHFRRGPTRRRRSERGSGTIHMLTACLLLSTALAVAVLWAAVSTARHKLGAAADLTALSAAFSLAATPCVAAERTAAANDVTLTACTPTTEDVTVQVSVPLSLPFLPTRTLSTSARAGPDSSQAPS